MERTVARPATSAAERRVVSFTLRRDEPSKSRRWRSPWNRIAPSRAATSRTWSPPRDSSKAPDSRCDGPSPRGRSRASIPSSSSTRWARSTTRPGEAKGAPDHPHRGFETVTYLLDGRVRARGLGRASRAPRPGRRAVDDGRLGRRALRDALEASSRATGGRMHGFQLWVNLPRARQDDGAALPGGPRGAASRSRAARRRAASA